MKDKGGNDQFTRQWIIKNSIEICDNFEMGILTLRALHYKLVGRGMTNDIPHYKRVVNAMIQARWDGDIAFEQFSDLERETLGRTRYEKTDVYEEITEAKSNIRAWMLSYTKNRWENQEYYVEVLIEKKALQNVFKEKCKKWNVALGACKGYPSLTFLNDLYTRIAMARGNGKIPVIIYFGDYDPSGEDIPRSIKDNLNRFGVDVFIDRACLMEDQVIEWKLPPAPIKERKKVVDMKTGELKWTGDTRSVNWDGLGQVELDAVDPDLLMEILDEKISSYFDDESWDILRDLETKERELYQKALKDFVANIS